MAKHLMPKKGCELLGEPLTVRLPQSVDRAFRDWAKEDRQFYVRYALLCLLLREGVLSPTGEGVYPWKITFPDRAVYLELARTADEALELTGRSGGEVTQGW